MNKNKTAVFSALYIIFAVFMLVIYKPQYFFDKSEKIDIVSVVRCDDFDNNRTFTDTVLYSKDRNVQNSFDVAKLENELYTLRCGKHQKKYTNPYSFKAVEYRITLQYSGETYTLTFTDSDVHFVLFDGNMIDILSGNRWFNFIEKLDTATIT